MLGKRIYRRPSPGVFLRYSRQYGQLPDWARRQVDKYLSLVLRTEGMSRAETEKEISLWNSENPELAMSSRSLRHARKNYREEESRGWLRAGAPALGTPS